MYSWRGTFAEVKRVLRKCEVCEKFAPRRETPPPSKTTATTLPPATHIGLPWERLHIDLIGPRPTTKNGNKHILVVVDAFTRWAEAIPIKTTSSVEMLEKLISEVLSRYGLPLELVSDSGSTFVSESVKQMCSLLGIEKTHSAPYRPQGNAIVERVNGEIGRMIAKYLDSTPTHDTWDEILPLLLFAYRTHIHRKTLHSPAQLMFGRNIRSYLERHYATRTPKHRTTDQHTIHIAAYLEKAFDIVRADLSQTQQQLQLRHQQQYYHSLFQPGNIVWVYNDLRKSNKKKQIIDKFLPRWTLAILKNRLTPITFSAQTLDGFRMRSPYLTD
jgi:transposase InsO family protein